MKEYNLNLSYEETLTVKALVYFLLDGNYNACKRLLSSEEERKMLNKMYCRLNDEINKYV